MCWVLFALRGKLFEGNSIQHPANFLLNLLPYWMNITVTGASAVGWIDNAPVRNDRPFDSFYDFQQRNVFRCAPQHKTATGTPERLDQAYFTELLEYLGEERGRDINSGGDIAQQADFVERLSCQIDDAPDCIFSFTSKFHHSNPPALPNKINALKKTFSADPYKRDEYVRKIISTNKSQNHSYTYKKTQKITSNAPKRLYTSSFRSFRRNCQQIYHAVLLYRFGEFVFDPGLLLAKDQRHPDAYFIHEIERDHDDKHSYQIRMKG